MTLKMVSEFRNKKEAFDVVNWTVYENISVILDSRLPTLKIG